MKIESFNKKYILEPVAVDEIAERTEAFLHSIRMEQANVIRVRLATEEALLRWMDHFGTGAEIRFGIGTSHGRPMIRLSLKGDPYDPLTNDDSDLGYWADSLTKSIGLHPIYSYLGDLNIITLKLPKPSFDPAKELIFSVLAGIIIGGVTYYILPNKDLMMFVDSYLDPIKEVFFRLLNIAAIPMIFLSVLSSACGAGTVADRGKNNRQMIVRFLLLSTLASLCGMAVISFAMGVNPAVSISRGDVIHSVFDGVMSLIPTDVMTPFQAGNSPQLIFMALVLGNALLLVGHQGDHLIKLVDESNHVILIIADWVSKLTPFFVILLLVLGIWDGSLIEVVRLWQPVILFALVSAGIIAAGTIVVCVRKHVNIRILLSKIKKPFWTALRHASVNEAYSENYNCCVNKLGIRKQFADYSVPLGLILYQPIATTGIIMFTVYAAHIYTVNITLMWLITALFLAVALQAASPPVSGVNLLAYAAIFSKMGIPEEALILAMIVDVMFCFISAAVDQTMLEYDLVIEADKSGQLNKTVLKKK